MKEGSDGEREKETRSKRMTGDQKNMPSWTVLVTSPD